LVIYLYVIVLQQCVAPCGALIGEKRLLCIIAFCGKNTPHVVICSIDEFIMTRKISQAILNHAARKEAGSGVCLYADVLITIRKT
jgi:hypothetical protein